MRFISPLQYVDSLGESVIRLGLDRIRVVLRELGNPHDHFPSVHIAGTNGKGSVAIMMASALRKSGLKVGLYTSPHLHRINERFQINGIPISTNELNRIITTLRSNKKTPLTQFEFLTLIAFYWFKKKKVDVAVIETGLGGRLDATNALNRVLVSVITNIDLEHTNWLGTTRPKIAFEKAGIIKPKIPVVTGTIGSALSVIKKEAQKKQAPLIVVRKNKPKNRSKDLKRLSLKGQHQIENAGLAEAALDVLSKEYPKLSKQNILSGIKKSNWPGRFERFGKKWILDGAHNPAAIQTVVRELKRLKQKKVNLIFGSLRDKDVKGMVRTISPVVDQCCLVPINSNRTANPQDLSKLKEWKGKARTATSVSEAFTWGNRRNSQYPTLVTGSLYLVGDVRSRLVKIYSEKKKT